MILPFLSVQFFEFFQDCSLINGEEDAGPPLSSDRVPQNPAPAPARIMSSFIALSRVRVSFAII